MNIPPYTNNRVKRKVTTLIGEHKELKKPLVFLKKSIWHEEHADRLSTLKKWF